MEVINFEHIQFLEALIDWRILDYKTMIDIGHNGRYANYETIKKLVQRLRSKKIVETYRDPWSKKTYIYLSPAGERIVSPDLGMNVCRETIYHDLKVSGLCYELSKISKIIQKVELEHRFKGVNKKSFGNEIVPDAKIFGEFKGNKFLAAIELELSQKEKGRILAKCDLYLKSDYYDLAFYFFPNLKLLSRYRSLLEENYGEDFNKRIFLFTSEHLTKGKGSLLLGAGRAMSRDQSLYELFEIDSFAPE